jgi:ribosomal protein L40E
VEFVIKNESICPNCQQTIDPAAFICRYCGYDRTKEKGSVLSQLAEVREAVKLLA